MFSLSAPRGLTRTLVVLSLSVAMIPTHAMGQQEKVLFSFNDTALNGYGPYAGVIMDKAGNLYGTTEEGGSYYAGTVFELTQKPDGGWTEKILHNFHNDGADGVEPFGGLIFDGVGNLYGTTLYGGSYGAGAVFELIPEADGGWQEKILHSFVPTSSDGEYPSASLIMDGNGNLYGTTVSGGSRLGSCSTAGCGTVFELKQQPSGSWDEKILHSFDNNNGMDGANPWAGLVFDGKNHLYGTTETGGATYAGTVFALTRNSSGEWSEAVLYSFDNSGVGGKFPQAGLVLDGAGHLYGTTTQGGTFNDGTVFKLTPSLSSSWTEAVLHDFAGQGDGAQPGFGSLVFDSAGTLYGTTIAGGLGYGTVFALQREGGYWKEAVLFSFPLKNGWYPQGGLALDAEANLYGTTLQAGDIGYGTVFEIKQ